jgi:hypothetical protein
MTSYGEFGHIGLEMLDDTFARLHAQAWIDEFKVEQESGKLDGEATAARIGNVTILREAPPVAGSAQGELRYNANTRTYLIYVNPESEDQTFTEAHEFGHLFLESAIPGANQSPALKPYVEGFCDFFGRQMTLPAEKLTSIDEVTPAEILKLTEQFDVQYSIVIYQLMQIGKLPRRIYVDTLTGEMLGELDRNEFDRHKVHRYCLCLNCKNDSPHAEEEPYIPVLDLTMFEWADISSGSSCAPNWYRDTNLFAILNKAYGRWTEKDEIHALERARHLQELWRNIIETVAEDGTDDDIPF